MTTETKIETLSTPDQYHLAVQLGGRSAYGFFHYYYNRLPHHRTQAECFRHVNDLYYELFGEYRYESYDAFRHVYNRRWKEFKEYLKRHD